jgi:hypothetical protein
MTSAAESITESLRRSRQMMVQVSMATCSTDNYYADGLFLVNLKPIDINVYRKWKEVQVPWQHLVCILN